MQTHSWGAIWGLYSDNGKFERKWKSLSWVYIGMMEKKMETTIMGLYRVNGTRTWKVVSWGYIGFRAQGFANIYVHAPSLNSAGLVSCGVAQVDRVVSSGAGYWPIESGLTRPHPKWWFI